MQFDAAAYKRSTREQWQNEMLSRLDAAGRAAAWSKIQAELAQFDGTSGFTGPCELMVASGTK